MSAVLATGQLSPATARPYDGNHAGFTTTTTTTLYGTAGSVSGVTASTTNNNTSVTLSASHGLVNGDYVTIGSQAGAFVLSSVGATSATLNRVATATASGQAVQKLQVPDTQLTIGYNYLLNTKASEPQFVLNLESDYLDADGYRKFEYYGQYVAADGSPLIRPFFFAVNRDLETAQGGYMLAGTQGMKFFDDQNQALTVARVSQSYMTVTKFGVGTNSEYVPLTDCDVQGTIRATGNNAPSSGAGIELRYDSGAGKGVIATIDRGVAMKDLELLADDVWLSPGGGGSTKILTAAGTTGRIGIKEESPDYVLDVNGSFGFTPGASVTPVDNGDVVIEATNNTTLTFKLKGSDGTIRTATLTLS